MSTVWIELTEAERQLLGKLLADGRIDREYNDLLRVKLDAAFAYPDITVGVYGGQVQWIKGNPYPIQVCDYDGERDDLPSVDKHGDACRIWFEPADNDRI